MTVYAYVRVSTSRQAEDGESLDVQQRQVEGYAKMHGWSVDRVFVERGVSGSVPLEERPEGKGLLSSLKPGDVLVAAKLDRIFRSALDALSMGKRLREQGVSLHLIDLGGDVAGNGLAKVFFTIAAAFAEAERDRIRERVKGTKEDQKARGRYLGGKRPFGFKVTEAGALEADPAEQAAITKARRMRSRGKSLRAIAKALQEAGHSISHEGVKGIVEGDRNKVA
jgi:DNA invertase Pin-like site-specific DNA recombinase